MSVKDPVDGHDNEVALRFDGDLIGETAILKRRGRRNATVQVVSAKATLIRISRQDVLELIRSDASVAQAILAIWELAAARGVETQQVLGGEVHIENRVMSVLLADLHNFTILGEAVWDELSEAFLFEFVEAANEISGQLDGIFEDQGDGFKIVFSGNNHAGRAVSCAKEIMSQFCEIRVKWGKRHSAFEQIGLGVGVCTDCMSIRRKSGSLARGGRIVSHAMNVAAAMAKQKVSPTDVDIFLDDNTASILRSNSVRVGPAEERWLERLNRTQTIHRLLHDTDKTDESKGEPDRSQITILIVAAEPTDESRLRLSQEVREIKEVVRLSTGRDQFLIHDLYAVRPGDLMQGLLDHNPTIVHFSGHGTGKAGLCLEGSDGQMHLVSADALTALFKEFSATLQCVILNACYSEIQADGIVKAIRYVVGMRDRSVILLPLPMLKAFTKRWALGSNYLMPTDLGASESDWNFPLLAKVDCQC